MLTSKVLFFEIILHETVFHAIGIEFYTPTVVRKLIVVKVNFRSAIHKNGSRVVIENIVFDFTERKVFEQKSINAISPVIEEFILYMPTFRLYITATPASLFLKIFPV